MLKVRQILWSLDRALVGAKVRTVKKDSKNCHIDEVSRDDIVKRIVGLERSLEKLMVQVENLTNNH